MIPSYVYAKLQRMNLTEHQQDEVLALIEAMKTHWQQQPQSVVSGLAQPNEFDGIFWPSWKHKEGKKAAQKAFLSARRRAALEVIMDGVRRYTDMMALNPTRPWLHASTFLNNDRWEDQYAPALTMFDPRKDGLAMLAAAIREQEDEQAKITDGNVLSFPVIPSERDADTGDNEDLLRLSNDIR
jgi:hypothetical protein